MGGAPKGPTGGSLRSWPSGALPRPIARSRKDKGQWLGAAHAATEGSGFGKLQEASTLALPPPWRGLEPWQGERHHALPVVLLRRLRRRLIDLGMVAESLPGRRGGRASRPQGGIPPPLRRRPGQREPLPFLSPLQTCPSLRAGGRLYASVSGRQAAHLTWRREQSDGPPGGRAAPCHGWHQGRERCQDRARQHPPSKESSASTRTTGNAESDHVRVSRNRSVERHRDTFPAVSVSPLPNCRVTRRETWRRLLLSATGLCDSRSHDHELSGRSGRTSPLPEVRSPCR